MNLKNNLIISLILIVWNSDHFGVIDEDVSLKVILIPEFTSRRQDMTQRNV